MSLLGRPPALLTAALLGLLCVACGGGAKPKGGAVVYAAVGDSTGAGFGTGGRGSYVERLFARIEQGRPGSRLVNLSTPLADTGQALRRQVGKALEAGPTLVTVGVGLNDLLQGVPEEQFAENYEEIISRLKGGGAVVIATTLPDVSTAPALSAQPAPDLPARLAGFNRLIESAAGRHGATVVDLYGMTREALRAHPEYFASDGLHPSEAGSEYWAEALWPAVSEAVD